MKRIGLIVNPVAGMGGSVGLKGTDGNVEEARRRGAVPHATDRATAALGRLAGKTDLVFITCSGSMGADALKGAGITDFEEVYRYTGESSQADTKNAVKAFLKNGVDLVLFCGGDGTARDVFDITGRDVPLLGIPAGVKMYSAVFAVDPASAADLVQAFDRHRLRDAEVMDVDEDAYRANTLKTRLYGIARTPALAGKTQAAKAVYEEADEERAKAAIAQFVDEIMLRGTLYIIGAGTTTEAIARRLGIKKTLLGVDAVRDRRLVATDCDEKTLLALADKYPDTRIILSPIGAQGFVLGRGNQQISAALVRKVGIKNLIVIATPHKLAEIKHLYIDSGDPDLDREFGDSLQVISGYRIAQRKKIHH
ncbi:MULTISPECIES: ATP-NAD kinase family protein [unclassified Methanoregula]|uniref:ATP-NAD kinase family protein n=1 Tax=unclassified Methanoregula TaxID=2649730 RepID=UPI0009D5B358|nr:MULTISPECIES: ATP-NAD kinase family protein [unclassified Methanoregula]OPX63178.1 MAG: ATP-NAD kinase [Methanoregula sp. PtaB.Bin085]OPY33478.1 MAG: ATP-NAD kinase [Methanoregula sp. PtaU1.Bin006]